MMFTSAKTREGRKNLLKAILRVVTFRSNIIGRIKSEIQRLNHGHRFLYPSLEVALTLIQSKPLNFKRLPFQTDIIIPVYNGMEFLDIFFQSIFNNTHSSYRLIVIDDCSPDEQIWPFLNNLLASRDDVVLIRNDINLGFVKTFNRGFSLAHNHFVCLNTDVILPPFWLERLMLPILKNSKVASVTPFTNSGTICSFPVINQDNKLFGDFSTENIDSIFMKLNPNIFTPILPTSVGFCAAFNNNIAKEIGMFDEIYSPGYGEENDWSLRAQKFGYLNVVAPNLFVYHKHGASFSTSSQNKHQLIEDHLRILISRYPSYFRLVESFMKDDPLSIFRSLTMFIAACNLPSKAGILIVDHGYGGGANKYRDNFVNDILDQGGQSVLILTYDITEKCYILKCTYDGCSSFFSFSSLSTLKEFSKFINLESIFFNNCASFPEIDKLISVLLFIKLKNKTNLVFAYHDFYSICPSYTLLNKSGRYCNLPKISECNGCLKSNSFAVNPQMSDIVKWRNDWRKIIMGADKILFFSKSTYSIVKRIYSFKEDIADIIPHQVAVSERKPQYSLNRKLNIGVVGTINFLKGAKIIEEMSSLIEIKDLDIVITVVGTIRDVTNLKSCVKIHGEYQPEELPDLIEKYSINVLLFTSIWPETFSYVVSELMNLDMPIFSFDVGAPPERLKDYSKGYIISDISAEVALDEILDYYNKNN